MAKGKGFRAIAGATQSTTWGTPVAVGAGEQFEFRTESLTPDVQFIADDQITGQPFSLAGDKGNEFHSGDITLDLRYEGVELFLALAMGSGPAPSQLGGEDAYSHVLSMATDLEGKHATIVFDKGLGKVWEYTTAKIGGFTISQSHGQRALLTIPVIPQGLNRNDASGTNNTTSIGTLTLPTNRDFLKFAQMKVYINAASAGALTPGTDDVYITEFETTLDRMFPTDDVTTQFGDKIDEPVMDALNSMGGRLSFSKASTDNGGNDALFDALLDKSEKKMLVEWTGPTLDTSYQFKLSVYYPSVQFESGDENVGGHGRIPLNLNFVANQYGSTPTGFPTSTTLPKLILQNQIGTAILA